MRLKQQQNAWKVFYCSKRTGLFARCLLQMYLLVLVKQYPFFIVLLAPILNLCTFILFSYKYIFAIVFSSGTNSFFISLGQPFPSIKSLSTQLNKLPQMVIHSHIVCHTFWDHERGRQQQFLPVPPCPLSFALCPQRTRK